MNPGVRVVVDIVFQAAAIFLLAGSVAGLLLGLILVLDSERAFRLNERLNRWFSSRTAMRGLDRSRDVDAHLFRWHRAAGVAVCLVALYSLYVVLYGFKPGPLVYAFRGLARPEILDLAFGGLRSFLLVGNCAAFVAGAVLLVRPEALRSLQRWADRRYSARKQTKPLDELNYAPDRFVRAHPVLVGTILILGGCYVLLNFATYKIV